MGGACRELSFNSPRALVNPRELWRQLQQSAEAIMEEGGIEACVCAMRANTNKMDVVKSSARVMLKLSHLNGGPVAVARQGGTRQIINSIQVRTGRAWAELCLCGPFVGSNRALVRCRGPRQACIGQPNSAEAMSVMMKVMEEVSTSTEASQILVNQGAADAVRAVSLLHRAAPCCNQYSIATTHSLTNDVGVFLSPSSPIPLSRS